MTSSSLVLSTRSTIHNSDILTFKQGKARDSTDILKLERSHLMIDFLLEQHFH